MIPISIKHILQNGGFSNARNLALQAWHGRRRQQNVAGRNKASGDDIDADVEGMDPLATERLLAGDEEDGRRSVASSGTAVGTEATDRLDLWQTARLSLEFCMLWFFANYFASACLEYTSVASVTILTSTSSVWTLVLCAVLRIEPFSVRKLVGVLASLAGIVLISMVDLSGEDNDEDRGNFPHKSQSQIAIGDAMALVSAVVYGLYVVVMKQRVGNEDRVNMPLFFGLVGCLNIILLWPLFFILHWTGIEPVSLGVSFLFSSRSFFLPFCFHLFFSVLVQMSYTDEQPANIVYVKFEMPPTGKIWLIIMVRSPTRSVLKGVPADQTRSTRPAAQLDIFVHLGYVVGVCDAANDTAGGNGGALAHDPALADRRDDPVRAVLELHLLGRRLRRPALLRLHQPREPRGGRRSGGRHGRPSRLHAVLVTGTARWVNPHPVFARTLPRPICGRANNFEIPNPELKRAGSMRMKISLFFFASMSVYIKTYTYLHERLRRAYCGCHGCIGLGYRFYTWRGIRNWKWK